MSKTLIVGDIHLEKAASASRPGIGGAFNSRVVDQLNLLDWIFEQANHHHVNDIIITGDVFHNVKPDYSIVMAFLHFLQKCDSHDVQVHIILGNHELKRTGNVYSSVLDLLQELSNVNFYKNLYTMHREGVSFTFMPFRDRRSLNVETHKEAIGLLSERLPFELAEIPSHNDKVLVGHLALEGSMPIGDEFDDTLNELMCPLTMFNGYDYVWMGHVHKPQILSSTPYIAHIGSLDISDFGETDHTKIIILYDPSAVNKFETLNVPSRPLKKISIQVPEDQSPTEYVLEQLKLLNHKSSLKNHLIKLEVKILSPIAENLDRAKIESLLETFEIHYLSNFSQSKASLSILGDKKEQEINSSIEPKNAVKLFADQINFDSDEEKKLYIQYANEVIDEYQLKIKK